MYGRTLPHHQIRNKKQTLEVSKLTIGLVFPQPPTGKTGSQQVQQEFSSQDSTYQLIGCSDPATPLAVLCVEQPSVVVVVVGGLQG